ncbi:radical SAM protein [Muricoccus nepalensis]|nr:radical SAM protein [Roseomonas nepalensis]
MIVTNTCNLNCAHCYSDCTKTPSSKELTTAEWKEVIDHLVSNDVMHVFIEGGEPFSRPDFLELLSHMSRRLDITVRTFANLITPEIAREIKRLKVSMVCVDFLGPDAETHDYLSEVPGSFEAGLQGARNLKAAGVPVYTLMILNRANHGKVQQYLELASSLGAYKAAVLRFYPIGRAKRRWSELALSLSEMEEAITNVSVPAGLHYVQSWHPNDGNTCYQMSSISPHGRSIGCPYLREFVDLGDVRTKPFIETWDDPLWKELRSGVVEDACAHCHDTQKSNGGCRATAFAFHGRWDAPDPFCSHMNAGVDLKTLPEEMHWRQPWVER